MDNSKFISPTRAWRGRIRSTVIWNVMVTAIAPVFEFFWEYLFNVREKLLYLGSGFASRGRPLLNECGIEILRGDKEFEAFARWLRSRISDEAIAKRREELMERTDEYSYGSTLDDALDEETRFELLKCALSDTALRAVLPYFRVVPRIGSIHMMFNMAKPELGPVGSKAWHRDGGQYKALNIFMCLSEVDENSGAYYAIGKNHIPYHAEIPHEVIDKTKSLWTRLRHSDRHMRKFAPESAETKLEGPIGTTALVDPGACYHKGGYCKTRDRIMLQISYVTDVPSPIRSVLTQMRLSDHPGLKAVLDSRVRRYMVSGNENSWYRRLGLQNPIPLISCRILTYHLTSSSTDCRT